MLPPCLPPVLPVRHWFYLWSDSRVWLTISHTLLMVAREAGGCGASPSPGASDSQSVKTTDGGGPRGYDAGKKINGRKRHILAHTDGNLGHAAVHAAVIQGRDVGASSGSWLGSIEIDALPRISSKQSHRPPPGSSSYRCSYSFAASIGLEIVVGIFESAAKTSRRMKAHSVSSAIDGPRALPISVSEYSTRGGTSG